MRILYGICSWGLGHATRSLPVIRRLLKEDNKLTIISDGGAFLFLRKELNEWNDRIDFVKIPDYPIPVSESVGQFIAKSIVYWPLFMRRMQKGLMRVTKLLEKTSYKIIVSDGRYDIYSKRVPSFFISHQVRIMNPLRIRFLETGSEVFNLFFLKRFRLFLVPDYKYDDLSGDLSHNLRFIKDSKLRYVGVLSDFKKKNIKKDIDYLISLSGPEPQRTLLEKKIMNQIDSLKGRVVVTLGKTTEKKAEEKGKVRIYSIVNRNKREELMNRAKLIISRSGYSTIMDLAVIKTKSLMIPTPGQVEQEYLAEYHKNKNTAYSVIQDRLDLQNDTKLAKKTTGIKRKCNVDKSIENVLEIIYENA